MIQCSYISVDAAVFLEFLGASTRDLFKTALGVHVNRL